MIDKNLEIFVGDTFKPKPSNRQYTDVTVKIVKIEKPDQRIGEPLLHVEISDTRSDCVWTDEFWRDPFLGTFNKA